MNLASIQSISLVIFLFFVTNLVAQNNNTAAEVSNDDTLRYLVPKQAIADLSLLTPPSGFVVSDAFNGYICYPVSSAIIMTMIENTTYNILSDGMTEEFFAKNNLTYISDSKFLSENKISGKYFKLSFQLEGDEYIRYVVFAGNLEKTLWLNITYPKKVEDLVENEILKSIQSITLTPVQNEK